MHSVDVMNPSNLDLFKKTVSFWKGFCVRGRQENLLLHLEPNRVANEPCQERSERFPAWLTRKSVSSTARPRK